MKIEKIVLYNIGPYVDKNQFDIRTDEKNKNIVLIGGKNGAGKTTFFKAIKTCLYGCRVWGFDAPGKEYFSIIGNLVNMKMQYDSSVKAYIEIVLLFDDGKERNLYTLHREWIKNKKAIEEFFLIKKNGQVLGEDDQADFSNYLLSIIPPDMFNFYFFDGESIDLFFLGNNGGKNFKNAFLKLYGLDTLSLMVDNFERYSRKRELNNTAFDIYQSAKKDVQVCEESISLLKEKKEEIETKIDLLQIKIQAMQKEYTQAGGVSISEWKSINTDLTREEAKREELNRWLKEVANHYLPFIIVEKNLRNLLEALDYEQTRKKRNIFFDVLKSNELVHGLGEFLAEKGVSSDTAKEIIDYICTETSDEDFVPLFDFSDAQVEKLYRQIYEKLEFDAGTINKAVKGIAASINESKKLREKLNASSIDEYETYSTERENIDKSIAQLTVELAKISQNIELQEADLLVKQRSYEKAKEIYEKMLKSKSISDMSMRAIGEYTLLIEKLIARQGKILQEEFIRCFTSIINKENFLDGIVIDKNINVIPYKFIDVTFVQIENYLKQNEKTHFLDLFSTKYLADINQLRLGNVDSVKLPTPINAPFSQGERQVYIMSIYLALLKTSRKDIPFFIDTPFARIDSNHRDKIVREFFMSLSNQIFLLSTDEEIVGQYEGMIEVKVSNKFLLNIDTYGKTSILPEKYFEV